jgi:hypothetical protein
MSNGLLLSLPTERFEDSGYLAFRPTKMRRDANPPQRQTIVIQRAGERALND